MSFRLLSFVCALSIFLWSPIVSQAETIRLAVTTSFNNSGLSDVLLPALTAETGIKVEMLVVGTGQALRLGRAGDVDAILVHSRAAEEAFVAEGYGTHRREIMYNDFVLVGPQDDPAEIAAAISAQDALERIAATRALFISRGDDSGTHRRELALWDSAQQTPEADWYRAVGAGMGASLNTAAGLGGYILTDRASWLNFGNPRGLALLFEGDPVLFNQYSYLPVSPQRHPHVAHATARLLEAWLSRDAGPLIDGYRIDGQRLFTFNAR